MIILKKLPIMLKLQIQKLAPTGEKGKKFMEDTLEKLQ